MSALYRRKAQMVETYQYRVFQAPDESIPGWAVDAVLDGVNVFKPKNGLGEIKDGDWLIRDEKGMVCAMSAAEFADAYEFVSYS